MIKLTNKEVTPEDMILIHEARDAIRVLQEKEDAVFHNLLKDLNLEIGPEEDRAIDYDYLFDYVHNSIFFNTLPDGSGENES
jgi:hypothetical protein